MTKRFSHFKTNVGWSGIARTVAIGAVVLVFAILNPEPPFSMPVALASLLLPALFRRSLAANPEFWSGVLRKAATGIFLLTIVGSDPEVVRIE